MSKLDITIYLGCQPPGEIWGSHRITINLQSTEVTTVRENKCFGDWTLWHHTALRSLSSPHSTPKPWEVSQPGNANHTQQPKSDQVGPDNNIYIY